jgi:hypothetical protein
VVATGYGDEGRRKSVARLKEPADGEMRLQRGGDSRSSRRERDVGQRRSRAGDELDIPEFIIPNA